MPVRRGADGGRPVVQPGAHQGHRDVRLGALGVGQDGRGVDRVVSLAEHRRGDVELLIHDGLGRQGSTVDNRCHVQHGDAPQGALGGRGQGARCHADDATGSDRPRTPGRSGLCPSCKIMKTLQETDNRGRQMSPMLRSRESHPSLQRPHRPARTHRRAGRPRQQPALVVAPADPRPVRRARPQALGRSARTRSPCWAALSADELAGLAADPVFVARVHAAAADLQTYLHPAAVVPEVGRGGRGRCPRLDRLLLPRVRHHRGAAAVLRRPRHPGRRPPQVRLRPRRADRRCRPLLQDRLLQAVAQPRRLAAGELPGPRPGRPAAGPAARGRRHALRRRPRPARRPHARGPRLEGAGRPGAAAAARLRRRGQRRLPAQHHRPAVRRRRRAPPAAGDAARHRRRARAAAVVAADRRPGAGRLPHQRGPRRLPGPRAHPRADQPAPHVLRRGARGRARRHGVHHPHAGAGRHRPLRRRPDRDVLRRRQRASPASRSSGSSRSAPRTTPAASRACSTWRSWACASAQRANGVSQLHGVVSRHMFDGLWPGFDDPEVPITSITNGVHAPTWVDRKVFELAARAPGHPDVDRTRSGSGSASCPVDEIWATGASCATQLVEEARRRVRSSWLKRGASRAELGWVDDVLDPDVLTIGFARRVPTYKRLTLMLRDPERLKRAAARPRAADPARHRRQVAPGRRQRQEADPADGAVRRRPRGPAPDRLPAQLRHRDGAVPLPGLRRLAEQPAAPVRGLRHVGHEVRAQRRPQPVDPRRLVGRVVRRRERLGHPDRRRRRGPRPPRRPRGRRALRPDRDARSRRGSTTATTPACRSAGSR